MTQIHPIPQGPPPGITPILLVDGAESATRFYTQAFAAQEIARIASPNGNRLLHCRMLCFGSVIVLMDEFPELAGAHSAFHPPAALKGTTVTLHVQVDAAQQVWDRAVAAGATAVIPLAKQFWGELYGRLRDPYGHEWTVAQSMEHMDNEAVQNAFLQQST